MPSVNRDIAKILGRTEAVNPSNAALGTGSGGGSLTVYATKEDLPASGLTVGDQAYVSASSRLYVSNGSGWYNIALINATPSLSIDPTGTIVLSTTGETTTITLTATDSDNAVAGLTYSVESDGSFGGLGTISQDSSVFTITPLSEDSATTASAVLTFKASDGINFGSGDRTLTLSFKVENSNYTTLLLKNEETTDNQVDASSNSHTITEYGNVTSTALSPYHPGGYSTYFDGSGGDWIKTDTHADFAFQAGDFTIECWYYPVSKAQNYPRILHFGTYWSNNQSWTLVDRHNSHNTKFWVTSFSGISILSTTTVENNNWYHLAVERSGTTLTLYVNGIAEGTANVSTNNYPDASATSYLNIGNVSNGSNLNESAANGYVRDVRVVKGSAVYTSNFTPSTSPLTAVTNTKFLLDTKITEDISGEGHTATANGSVTSQRFGPFDYLGYAKANHGGSVYFDGTGDYITGPTPATMGIGTGDFTIECWFYATAADTDKGIWDTHTTSSSADGLTLTRITATTFRVWQASQILVSNATAITDVWNHLAVVRDNGTLELFVNGVSQGTVANTTNMNSAQGIVIGSGRYQAGSVPNKSVTGYISDFRVTTTAVYTSNFATPTAPLTAITNTQLLTCTNKNDIWDASSGNLLTKAGDVTGGGNSGTLLFGQTAIALDGTGDYVAVDRTVGHFGTDDFTVEGWWYFNTVSAGYQAVISLGQNTDQRGWIIATETNNGLAMYMSNGSTWSYIVGPSTVPTLNAWNHIAAVRNGSTLTLYLNGTSLGTANIGTNSTHSTTSGALYIGHYPFFPGGARSFNGYIQDVRITKGLARYTSNFTPPTAEFNG